MRLIGAFVALAGVKEPPTGSGTLGVAPFCSCASAGKISFFLIVGLEILAGLLLILCASSTPSSSVYMVGG